MLDNAELTVPRPTLAAAIAAAARAAEAAGRVIIDIKADGVAVPDDQLASPSDEPGGPQLVSCTSADPRALLASTFRDAAEALDRVREHQDAAARLIMESHTDRALGALPEILSTWDAVRQIVDRGTALLGGPLDRVLGAPADAPPLPDAAAALTRRLAALRDAIGAQDWSRLADLLAFDLADAAREWAALLRGFATRLSPGASE